VLMQGAARYGEPALMQKCASSLTTSVRIGNTKRNVTLRDPDKPQQAWQWADIQKAVDTVRNDPIAAVSKGPSGLGAVRSTIEQDTYTSASW